jgi:hypothetical protein
MAQGLPSDLEAFVQQELSTGRFRSREEMELHGLWLLKRERDEALAGIERGLVDVRAGRVQPLDEAVDELRKELGIPSGQ